MARAHYIKSANKNIYENGKYVTYESKKGKRAGSNLTKLDRTIPRDKDDKVLIKKGQEYWWWQFKGGGKQISATRPKQSQLTRSSYLSTLYDIQDTLSDIRGNVGSAEDLQSEIDDVKSQLEDLKSECENSLDQMPDQLRESSSSGQLLQERIDSLDNAINELDGLDLDYDEPDEEELKDEVLDDLGIGTDEDGLREAALEALGLDEEDLGGMDDEDKEVEEGKITAWINEKEKEIDARISDLKDEKISEWLDEKCDEVTQVSFE